MPTGELGLENEIGLPGAVGEEVDSDSDSSLELELEKETGLAGAVPEAGGPEMEAENGLPGAVPEVALLLSLVL